MIPAAFAYERPATIDEALGLLARYGDGARALAGGQTLLPLLKLRLASAERLIDIGRIPDLQGIRDIGGGGVAIGALTTYRQLLDSALIAGRFRVLAEAVDMIADVQVRNRGTVGGGLAHADPASDLPALALALDAQIVLRSAQGERAVAAEEFFLGPFETAAAHDELLTEIRLPAIPTGAGAAYVNLEQRASGYSIVGVAAVVGHARGVLGSTTYDHVRVAITGVSDHAYRATEVEQSLVGTVCGGSEIDAAAARATGGRRVLADIHADAEYRGAMATVLARRALNQARARSS